MPEPVAPKPPKIGLVGRGRVARHLGHYLGFENIAFVQGPHRGEDFSDDFRQTKHILVALSDDAIEPWIENFCRLTRSEPRRERFIHFSASLYSVWATSFHPLMSFGPELYGADLYPTIPFFCEAEGGASFHEVFPTLKNPHFRLRREDKAFYHALCVLSGNFSVLLWQKFFAELEGRLGASASAGIPYLRQVTENLTRKPQTALTGPLQRGDTRTLERDLEALNGDPYQNLFKSFLETFAQNVKNRS